MKPETNDKLKAYVEATQPLLEKAAAQEANVREKAPEVADALIKAGLLIENEREGAQVSLQDPVKALNALKQAAEEFSKRAAANASPAPMGMPAEKAASNKNESRSAAEQEAGDKFLREFGII